MSVQAKGKKGPEYKTGIALDILFGTADPALPNNSATGTTATAVFRVCVLSFRGSVLYIRVILGDINISLCV
jgi:hypothetical protein